MATDSASTHGLEEHHGHDHGHELPFWQKYIFSTDHKTIGIQYAITGLIFMLFGFCLMMLMRYQLAYSEQEIVVGGFHLGKWLEKIFGPAVAGGVMQPQFYNSLGAMHGTVMVFLGIVPTAFAAFGNYVVPLQIGANDMAFPKLNAASYWSYFVGGVVMLVSFFVPGGAAKSGWTSYAPLSVISDHGLGVLPFFNGQTLWILGMVFLISSSLLGSVNTITTIIQLRAPGMTWMRLPFFVWAQLITSRLTM